jgi:hypothetical protein
MKVFALGGAGRFGSIASGLLAASDAVDELIVAGRDIERTKRAVLAIGPKAVAMEVDGRDEARLARLLGGCDLLVNMGPIGLLLTALRASIRAGVHYCDLAGGVPPQALELHADAELAGVTAIVGTGRSSALGGVMAMHAASRLDQIEEVCFGVDGGVETDRLARALDSLDDPYETLAGLHEELDLLERLFWWSRMTVRGGTHVRYRNGRWEEVDAFEQGVEIPLPRGEMAQARPLLAGSISGALPLVPDVPNTFFLFSRLPPELISTFRDLARMVKSGEVAPNEAAERLYRIASEDAVRLLGKPHGFVPLSLPDAYEWVVVFGYRRGRPARSACWLAMERSSIGFVNAAPAVVAANAILLGEIRDFGVLRPQACFQPASFFAEVARLVPQCASGRELIGESLTYLD